jgi:N-acetylglucosaminyldiphosphoundecaprenol N-acetyl-beta-D-mannosaminyltransferase
MHGELHERCAASRRPLFGLDITTFDRPGFMTLLRESLDQRIRLDVAWLNPYYVQRASRDAELHGLLGRFDVLQPDGWGVVYAARLAKIPVAERLAIEDIERELFAEMARRGQSVYVFGCEPGMAERAAATLSGAFPGLVVAGTDHGWYDRLAGHPGRYSDADDDAIIERINAARPDLLLVSLPTPLQQRWIIGNQERLDVTITMAAGAYVDHLAEGLDYYPRWMERLRLDFFYRLAREPRRLLHRYTIGMVGYLRLVAGEAVRSRRRPAPSDRRSR